MLEGFLSKLTKVRFLVCVLIIEASKRDSYLLLSKSDSEYLVSRGPQPLCTVIMQIPSLPYH